MSRPFNILCTITILTKNRAITNTDDNMDCWQLHLSKFNADIKMSLSLNHIFQNIPTTKLPYCHQSRADKYKSDLTMIKWKLGRQGGNSDCNSRVIDLLRSSYHWNAFLNPGFFIVLTIGRGKKMVCRDAVASCSGEFGNETSGRKVTSQEMDQFCWAFQTEPSVINFKKN